MVGWRVDRLLIPHSAWGFHMPSLPWLLWPTFLTAASAFNAATDAATVTGVWPPQTFVRLAQRATIRAYNQLFGRFQVPAHQSASAVHSGIAEVQKRMALSKKVWKAPKKAAGFTISFYLHHDASVAVAKDGRVQCVLEMERLFEERYYVSKGFEYSATMEGHAHLFQKDWVRALRELKRTCECDDGPCPVDFDNGVIVRGWQVEPVTFTILPEVVSQVFRVKQWQYANHSEAHALMGFHSSPFHSALVLTLGNGANDGPLNAYHGVGLQLSQPIARLDYNLGGFYEGFAILLEEVTGNPQTELCEAYRANPLAEHFPKKLLYRNWRMEMSAPGKLMGYSALGNATELVDIVERCLRRGIPRHYSLASPMPGEIVAAACGPKEAQRNLGAAIQEAFQRVALEIVISVLQLSQLQREIDGIVLTGGCALNVLLNQLVLDECQRHPELKHLGVFVPAAANDAGLAVGGLWKVQAPTRRQPVQYTGMALWDLDTLEAEASTRKARSLTELGGVEYLAELLSGGAVWQKERGNASHSRPIVALVRGRQEFGPRALGHRSLVASPDSEDMRDRLNRLKARQWYRPVAPMIAEEALVQVFGRKVESPYMTMAPRVLEEVQKAYPALAHVDGTARHQSVSSSDEPWIHQLLLAVGKLTGLAALINTSFNSKGKPIANRVADCLNMLDNLPELDYVLIEDWLFTNARNKPL